ncbi:MAG: MlaD family protein [Phycisphaerae bacterium]|nr:MlaD family protein [Phycisphaerae bacterium]
MSTRPNYFKLGVFILVALVLLVAGIVLFGSGVMGQEKIYFETYFKESVSGLTPGASVQDNGVEIGTVEKISFVRNDYSKDIPKDSDGYSKYRPYVRVVCSVRSENLPEMTHEQRQKELDILVKNGLRLRLSTNILTGQGFIEAQYVEDPVRFPVESFPWETEYPYIPSAPSTFTTLKDSVDKILHRLEKIETEKIAENINEVLVSVNKAVNDAQIKTMRAEAGKLVEEIRQTNQHLIELLKNPAPEEELSNIADLVDRMDQMIARFDSLVRMNTPQIVEMLENFKQISDNLKGLTEDLEKSPSVIFSEPPEKKEMP